MTDKGVFGQTLLTILQGNVVKMDYTGAELTDRELMEMTGGTSFVDVGLRRRFMHLHGIKPLYGIVLSRGDMRGLIHFQ